MAATKLSIWNMALSHLGISKEVAEVAERSPEASACRRFYDHVVDEAMGDYAWSFTRKFATLALVEEAPTEEWAYSYRVPSDCVRIRRVLSGVRNDTPDSAAVFIMGQDDQGALLYTDIEDVQVEYSFLADDPSRYPSDFVSALSLLLAVNIAPRVTAGDPYGLRKDAMNLYVRAIGKAMANDANQGRRDQAPDSEFVRARS